MRGGRLLRTYAFLFGLWTVVGLFLFTQGLTQKLLTHDPTPWWHHLIGWLVGVYEWALITPAILFVGRRFRIERRNWKRRVPQHLALSAAVSVFQLAVEAAILTNLGIFPSIMPTFKAAVTVLLMLSFHQGVLTYWSILAAQFGIAYYHRYQERERDALRLELDASELKTQLARAQLGALKMQLQPHFLFNTLNAIMVLVRQQRTREAEEMLSRLSDLLRCVLEDVEAQEVPLRRELDYLQLYLSIEQVRFQDRLRIEMSVDPEVLEAAVPHMGLQPIVENAIRHGIGKSLAAGRVEITALRSGQKLEVQVRDDGPGLAPDKSAESRGIGLANTRARLARLYGEAAKLTVENGEQGGVVATMVVPYRLALEPDAEMMGVNASIDPDRG